MDDSPEIKVTIAFHPVKISFEAGSIDEAVAALTSMAPKLREARSLDLGANEGGQGAQEAPPAAAAAPAPEVKKPRGKKGADPATASAPPPLPVPNADPLDTTIPDAFRRTAPPAPPLATAPVPPLPGAPPIAPAPPPPAPPAPPNPTNALAKAVRAEVEKRGEVMLPWLVSANAVVAGATFDEALEVISFLSPDKLEPIAAALSVRV